jgi:hypothetical protein
MVSGQTPMVLKLNKQDCVAQSVSRRPEAGTQPLCSGSSHN